MKIPDKLKKILIPIATVIAIALSSMQIGYHTYKEYTFRASVTDVIERATRSPGMVGFAVLLSEAVAYLEVNDYISEKGTSKGANIWYAQMKEIITQAETYSNYDAEEKFSTARSITDNAQFMMNARHVLLSNGSVYIPSWVIMYPHTLLIYTLTLMAITFILSYCWAVFKQIRNDR